MTKNEGTELKCAIRNYENGVKQSESISLCNQSTKKVMPEKFSKLFAVCSWMNLPGEYIGNEFDRCTGNFAWRLIKRKCSISIVKVKALKSSLI